MKINIEVTGIVVSSKGVHPTLLGGSDTVRFSDYLPKNTVVILGEGGRILKVSKFESPALTWGRQLGKTDTKREFMDRYVDTWKSSEDNRWL